MAFNSDFNLEIQNRPNTSNSLLFAGGAYEIIDALALAEDKTEK